MYKKYLVALASFSMLLSCEKKNDEGVNKFSDEVIVKIYEYKDRRQSDSLYNYLTDSNPVYRKEAALAFASVQDSSSVSRLGKLLIRDSDSDVRKAAAFSLGQTKSLETERILLGALPKEKDAGVLSEILEAYGKATSHWQVVNPTYFHDSIEAEGLAWSVYRAGLRSSTDSVANRVAKTLLRRDQDESARLGAAHFFSRSASGFDKYLNEIKTAALSDPSIEVRMAAVFSLRKIVTPESAQAIKEAYRSDNDYRVKVNAVRALAPFAIDQARSELFNALTSNQANVAIAASEVLKNAAGYDWIELSNMLPRLSNWRVRANIYEAAFKMSPNDQLAKEIKAEIQNAANPYYRSALLGALQHDLSSFDFVKEQLMSADVPVVMTSAAASLSAMNRLPQFSDKNRQQFLEVSKTMIAKGDAGVIGVLCAALSNEKYNYKSVVSDIQFLKDARAKLNMPKDVESIQPLEDAIAFFENKPQQQIKTGYNHPIDWTYVKSVPKDQNVIIKTSRGNIRIRLAVEDSPGSVENFLKLARQNYFDNKVFHRVVPNFVIQGGCNRGDGFGSEDYSIRSEFSHTRYKTGSVGMASAGKDTEGTQWFITHSPTPHLDGGYTIFAEVVSGMEVVHLIEVGDKITDVEVVR